MIDIQGVEHKLKQTYGKVDTIVSNVFRCEKIVNGKPAAIIYFDCTGNLKTAKALVDYQDEVLAKDYFSHPGSLQWNFYLTFVVENLSKKDEVKRAIEEDIKYTRKFVIEDSQLEEFIKFSDLDVNNNSDTSNNLLGRWIKKLDKANLSGIYQEEPRTKVIRDYFEDKESTRDSQTSNATTVETEKFPYINAIILDKYRDWPQQGTYPCGSVNLITGANGVGKTSFLEAIEYYFCGKTKRNPNQLVKDESFYVEFNDKKGPQPFKVWPTSEYQVRSSQWFRKPTSRGNSLYEGFNQLIFYNTDAAFSLTSTEDNNKVFEAMSSLALGEETNRVSARIEAFTQDFDREVALHNNRKQKAKQLLDQELTIIRELTKQTSEQPGEVKALITTILKKMKMKEIDLESPSAITRTTKNIRLALSELSSICSQLNWISEPSINSIEIEITKYGTAQKHAEKKESELATLATYERAQKFKLAKLNDELEHLKKLQKFIKSGYFELNERLEKLENVYESNDKKLELIVTLDLKAVLKLEQSKTSSVIIEEITNALKDVDKQTELLDDQLESISSQVSELIQLSESIKKMGQDFIEAEPSANTCPLCNTPYPSIELKKRINLPAPKAGDAKGIPELQSKLAKLKTRKRGLQERKAIVTTYQKNIQELSKAGLTIDDTKSLDLQLKQITSAQEGLENQQTLMQQLQAKIEKLNEKGFDDEAWGLLKAELKLVKRPIKSGLEYSSELIEKGIADVQDEIESCQKLLAGQKDATEKVKSQFNEAIKKTFGPIVNLAQKAGEIDRTLVALSQALERVIKLQFSIELSKKTNFSATCTDLKRAEEWIEKLSILSKVEGDRAQKLAIAQQKVSDFEKELKSATKAYALSTSAHKVLTTILEKDSKAIAVTNFIKNNHTTIVNIFKKIHAPNEFGDIQFEKTGDDSCCIKLYRNETKTWVGLSKVSTGQRSALALSVFLALNLRVTGGPRLLLIDDPVAHVDDLNTLSFLDYLREIVVKDKRQLFFATASRKLASLFEMKFSNLEGFPLEIHRLSR
jgi:DNA repair protein SbcC/Rad50